VDGRRVRDEMENKIREKMSGHREERGGED
jgi:hypothetical protein